MKIGKMFLLNSDCGQAMLEFALATPLLMVLVLGALDVNRALHTYNTISEASITTAREISAANNLGSTIIPDNRIRRYHWFKYSFVGTKLTRTLVQDDVEATVYPPPPPSGCNNLANGERCVPLFYRFKSGGTAPKAESDLASIADFVVNNDVKTVLPQAKLNCNQANCLNVSLEEKNDISNVNNAANTDLVNVTYSYKLPLLVLAGNTIDITAASQARPAEKYIDPSVTIYNSCFENFGMDCAINEDD